MIPIGAKKKPNWDAIKAEYLAGATAADLAARYKVSIATLQSKASRAKWGEQRKEIAKQVQAELPGKIAEAKLESATEWIESMKAIAADLRERIQGKLPGSKIQLVSTKDGPVPMDVPFLNAAQDLAAITKALNDLDKLARTQYGLDAKPSEKPPGEDLEDKPQTGVVLLPMKDELPGAPVEGEDDGD